MLTVKEILRKARLEKGVELASASKDLRIQMRFLKALEDGDWNQFDGPAHVRGFLRNYADYLGLNVGEVLAFWRREYDAEEKSAGTPAPPQPLKLPRVIFTPSLLLTLFSTLFICLFLGYVIWQYQSFAGPPKLVVSNPASDLTTAEVKIEVWGKADKEAVLTINGQRVLLAEDGTFSTLISLSEGLNVLNFAAANKLGRQSRITRQVTVLPAEVAGGEVAGETKVGESEASVSATPSATLRGD